MSYILREKQKKLRDIVKRGKKKMIETYKCICGCIYIVITNSGRFMNPHCPICLKKSSSESKKYVFNQVPLRAMKELFDKCGEAPSFKDWMDIILKYYG